MKYTHDILSKIKKKKIKIAIIGLGYVGLPLSLLFSKHNIKVYGIDNDLNKINKLKKNKSTLKKISNKKIQKFNLAKNIFTNKYSFIKLCDFIIICLPTPLNKAKKPDLSFIKNSIQEIKKHITKGQTIILESTSYPGTTEERIVNVFRKKFIIGRELFVGFSPERINPGKNENSIAKVPKVVSGATTSCLKIVSAFYGLFFNKVVKAKNIKMAEFSKIFENTYRAINIGFVNEMKLISDKFNFDIFDVIKLAKTKPYGYTRFFPGPGVGGHCIPIDPLYLSYLSKKYKFDDKFITIGSKIDKKLNIFIINKTKKYLEEKNLNHTNSKILIIGLAYKKNIDDYRESPTLTLINYFKKNKFKKIYIHDPLISNDDKIRKKVKFVNIINSANLKYFDLVILMTDHDTFNYKTIYKFSKKIIDTRGRYQADKKVIRG